MSKPVIAVPYFPGSNGDTDVIREVGRAGMAALPLYFHIGDEQRLRDNGQALREADGAALPGGFPYEDRLGFGRIPASIPDFADNLRALVAAGKPVIAFCAGNQLAQEMGLAFEPGEPYRASMLGNICDTGGRMVRSNFLDAEVHVRLEADPERCAFTRLFTPGEVLPNIIDHGGGRFWTDPATLEHLVTQGMVVTRYCDRAGNVVDDYPINPNGSMLNIESLTNRRGNLKLGMCHDERHLNALEAGRAQLVFASMREYIEDGCPDLSGSAMSLVIPLQTKDFGYLTHGMDPFRTLAIYVQLLTQDNELNTARLFLGGSCPLEHRRVLLLEMNPGYEGTGHAQEAMRQLAGMDFLDGIMLKKDLPTMVSPSGEIFTYKVLRTEGKTVVRDFVPQDGIVTGYPVMHRQVAQLNPAGYGVRQMMRLNDYLSKAVAHVQAGAAWFFPDDAVKGHAVRTLIG